MPSHFEVQGFLSTTQRRYVQVKDAYATAVVPLEVTSQSRLLSQALAEQGVHVGLPSQLNELSERISNLSFALTPVAEHPGWNDDAYFFPNGEGFQTAGPARWPVAFAPSHSEPAAVGTVEAWRGVAKRACAHPHLALVLMLPFLPPLLRFMPEVESFVIELVGEPGIGKSLRRLAASAIGRVDHASAHSVLIPIDTFVRDPKPVLERGRDQLLVFDDLEPLIVGASTKSKQDLYRVLAYGTPRTRVRYVGLCSGARSARTLVSAGEASPSRLITLHLPGIGHSGAAHSSPETPALSAARLERFEKTASSNSGHAVRKFVGALVKKDQAILVKRLLRAKQVFLERAEYDGTDREARRVVQAFAAIYAAGREARLSSAFPLKVNLLEAALAGFNLWRQVNVAPISATERLEALVQSGDILTITAGMKSEQQKQAAARALGTLHTKNGGREVRILQANISRVFPDWESIQESEEVRGMMRRDGANRCPKAQLAPGLKSERMFCLGLPSPTPDESLFATSATEPSADDGWY